MTRTAIVDVLLCGCSLELQGLEHKGLMCVFWYWRLEIFSFLLISEVLYFVIS